MKFKIGVRGVRIFGVRALFLSLWDMLHNGYKKEITEWGTS